ncbi:MAG: cbb3-type cytochrome c oxidase subunit I [Acidimicrobiia bacterium]|nr:cbb3-type cytochrome c oxidase subunit I [Acidimicrobiia bacterium]
MTATQQPATTDAVVVEQRRWLKWQLYLGFVGLFLGLLMGFLQAMDRTGIDLYDAFQLQTYYQGLTLHAVSLAFVLTFTFANSFLTLTVMRSLDRPMDYTWMIQGSTITAALGVVLAAAAILMNQASVLYTFYSPLQASSLFYLGAVLLVVSTWLVSLNQMLTVRTWRKEHPGERLPLLAFVSLVTFLMWDLASLGVAVEVVVFLLPWSLGITEGVDPLLNRTLFWFTGHPIVYFWLLPAYVSWYMMIPKQVGGKLFSDGVVRGVFILFLLLSTPVGLHHQFTDPGIDEGLKLLHGVFTFGVFFPSVITAFTLMAALEHGGRRAGGKGLLGWILKLPWGDPVVVAQLLAMIGFVLGGATGLLNASSTMNLLIHNTSFVPGHFHLTVGTAVALTIMGVAYWLVPYLTGKPLWGRRLGVLQAWLWLIGVMVFSRGQMAAGIEGQPRRLFTTASAYIDESWEVWNIVAGIGGMIMFVSGVLFFVVIGGTLLQKQRVTVEMPVSECIHDRTETPRWLDRAGLWFVVAVVLVLIAYLPVFITHNYEFNVLPFTLY